VHITPGVYATRPEKSHCRNLVVGAKLLDNEGGTRAKITEKRSRTQTKVIE